MTLLEGLSGGSGSEAAAVLGRADAERADEGAPHGLGRAVPAQAGGLLHAVGGVFYPAAGGLAPDPADVTSGRQPDLGADRAGAMARGLPIPAWQGFDRQLGGRVVRDARPHLAQTL